MKDLIFDFGGVLVDWNPRYLYRKVFASNEEMEWFLSQVCTPQWNAGQDAGRPFEQGVKLLTEQYPNYAEQIKAFDTRWVEMLKGEIPGMRDLIHALKQRGYKMYGLTNWSAEKLPLAWERYEVLRAMDGVIVSGEEKMIKPDPDIYKCLLTRFNLQPENCIFIDDNAENRAAAQALGFEVIGFENATQLQRELAARQILV